MNGNTFHPTGLILAIVSYQLDRSMPCPVKVNDRVIWDGHNKLSRAEFEEWLDRYFEYVISRSRKMYRITGILTRQL
jgi:hypothetical protein